MKKDPVCSMQVKEDEAIVETCGDEVFYFCSEGCRDRFFELKECKVSHKTFDLIIVGGGPAGLTAAVYASTLKISALLISQDLGGQAIDSTKIENYMGFDFITGPELIRKFGNQVVHSHYIDHRIAQAEKIEPFGEGFHVMTPGPEIYESKAVIIATGMTRKKLGVPGEEKFQRKGLFYGSIQDYSFVQGEEAAVIGGGNSAFQLAENLSHLARRVNLISDFSFSADEAIIERVLQLENIVPYENFTVLDFFGDDSLAGIKIRRKGETEVKAIPVAGVFIAIGLKPNSGLVSGMVETNEKGEIKVNSDCSTSRYGIYAAGDVTDVFGKRIVIASGEGAKAALAVRQYLLKPKEKRNFTFPLTR